MLFGYCRVSKISQDLSKYIEQLKDFGIKEENIYTDNITGTKKGKDREGFKKLLDKVSEFDTIVIPDITRLGRSSFDLLQIVEELKEKNVGLKSLKEPWLDTTSDNPQSTLMLTMFSALAQYERDLISLRTKETLTHKKFLNGGKSINGRPSKSYETRTMITKMYNQGTWTIKEIQDATNCSRNTVYKYIKEGKEKGIIK